MRLIFKLKSMYILVEYTYNWWDGRAILKADTLEECIDKSNTLYGTTIFEYQTFLQEDLQKMLKEREEEMRKRLLLI